MTLLLHDYLSNFIVNFEGPTENRHGELGSLFKHYYYILLIGAYFFFEFENPLEAKGVYLFPQEYLLNDFENNRPPKYAASLV